MNRNKSKDAVNILLMATLCCSLPLQADSLADSVNKDPVNQQEQKAEPIPVIEIIGQPGEPSLLDFGGNQIPLTLQQIVSLPGSGDDPLNALDNLPGINRSGDGVTMHGSSTTDNKIQVDQLSVPFLYHFGNALSLVNKDILASYDVYPSGFGALFGNRLGGVIDIRLRDPIDDGETHQRLHLGTFDASYFIEDSLTERDSAYLSIRRSHLDLLLSGGSAQDVAFIQFPRFVDAVARWRHRLDNGEVNTTFIASTDDLIFELGEQAVDADKAAIGRFETSRSFVTLGSQYRSSLSDRLSQKTTLKWLRADNELKIGQQQAGDPNPGEPYHFDYSVNEAELNPVISWVPNRYHEIQLGLEAIQGRATLSGYISAPPNERDDPGDTLTSATKYTLNENLDYSANGLSVSYDRVWSTRLSSTLGLRAEDFRLYDRQITAPVSPRLSLSYRVNNDLKLTASYGIYYQAPQGFEMLESLGNPQLDYQQAEHRTLGLHYQLNPGWSALMTVYHKPMQDLVVETDDALRYNNNGSGEARGFDLFIKRAASQRRVDWLSYTYAQSDRVNHNSGLSRPFDGDQAHTLIWVHQQPFRDNWSAWQWGFKLKLHSGQPYTRVIAREAAALDSATDCGGDGSAPGCYWSPVYEAQNSSRLPGYFNIDLSMNKTVKNSRRHYDLKLELMNASELLYQNISDYDYGDEYQNIDNPKKVSASFGLLPAASFTLYF